MPSIDLRKQELDSWAGSVLGARGIEMPSGWTLHPVSDDASFRRYFRYPGDPSYIFVDAPPEFEDSRPFVHVAGLIGGAGLNVPVVLDSDLDLGFMMLTDSGSTLYLDRLQAGDADEIERLYQDAFAALAKMQQIKSSLPSYDENLLRTEMNLFPDWFLHRQLRITKDESLQLPETASAVGEQTSLGNNSRMFMFDESATVLLSQTFELMVKNAKAQPQVFVHRDYHCRNLMVTEHNNPGILDFQDAVTGPVTYDLVSLLKDCYHRFPRQQVERWVEDYRLRLTDNGSLHKVSASEFLRWFDFMGFQRQLKCAGIFSRLHLRDGKVRYLADIPLVIDYMVEVSESYPELSRFGHWLNSEIVPRLNNG